MRISALPGTTAATESTVPLPWDSTRDPAAACPVDDCGHPYHRHFDWGGFYGEDEDEGEQRIAVGCKYCPCYAFGGVETPKPPTPGTVGHLLTIIEPATDAQRQGQVLTALHATHEGATRALLRYVTDRRALDADAAPEEGFGAGQDPGAVFDAFFAETGAQFHLAPLTVQE